MKREVITRFAPSPTGFLHIGGARTALFNWLYARHCGGKMLLRIEDTDRERSSKAAVTAILDGLKWLGLEWEGEAISQFARLDRHAQVAHELVKQGKAYYCYASREELDEMREQAKAKGLPPRYDGRWRDRDAQHAPSGVNPVIRIKAPQTGEIIVEDRVQGHVTFAAKDMDDFIILRSDGTPTYMHAVVVDDHDMGITHIIRGDDHLTNAARQIVLYQALGWEVPIMAHIPLIHGADGAKLSKRHGALGVEAYRAMGYLPQGLCNYLVRLGWSHGDDELMSKEQMINWFDIDDVNKGAARFDFKKLEAINGYHIRNTKDDDLVKAVLDTLPEIEGGVALIHKFGEKQRSQLLAAMSGLKERAKTLIELIDNAHFITADRPLALDEKAGLILNEQGRAILTDLLPKLKECHSWNDEALATLIRIHAEKADIKLKDVAQPLRAALTGRATSPGVFEVMVVLGREESLARIEDQIR